MAEHSDVCGSSSANRIMNCPASVQLCKTMPPRPSSSFADEGTMLHGAMEELLLTDKTPAQLLDEGFSYTAEDGTIYFLTDDLVVEMIEPALKAFDALVNQFGSFEYEIEARCDYGQVIPGAFGTADVLGVNKEYSFVIDWKFGRGVGVSAHENAQLSFIAGAGRLTPEYKDMFSADRKIVGAIIQPAMDEPGSVWVFNDAFVNGFTNDLQTAVKCSQQDPERTKIAMAEGSWCRWCDAKPVCPEQRKGVDLALPMAEAGANLIKIEDLPDLLAMADKLEPWVKAVKQLAHSELDRGVPVKGWKLVAKRATRKWSDEKAATRRLKGMKFKAGEMYEKKLISPAKTEKLVKKAGKDFGKLDEFINKSSSGTTMAPEDDKRPAVKIGGGANLQLPPKT